MTFYSNSLYHQQGVGLLELMLALSIATILIILSIRTYQSFSSQANARVILEASQSILAAGNAYYTANCSSVDTLNLGQWQNVEVLKDFLPSAASLYNPWGTEYAPGVYYQIQFMRIPSAANIVFCVQTNLTAKYQASQYYQLLGATTYSDAPSATGIFCRGSGTNTVIWQSLPSSTVSGYMDAQSIERLKIYRSQNLINQSSLCPN